MLPPSEDDEYLRNWRRELRRLWTHVFIALNKAIALGVAVLIHKGLDWGAQWVIPERWPYVLDFIRGLFALVFIIIYTHFGWEILAAFVPVFSRIRFAKLRK
jgi:hypothetical protein